jgi:hypothetical protein
VGPAEVEAAVRAAGVVWVIGPVLPGGRSG